ncbi:MAG TPA: LD-carboxypeptidase, partial [Thermoanaerobaculia bacterium]|nr:LD-carboxypeptidase [Thermoanaerobaculia bacterium]
FLLQVVARLGRVAYHGPMVATDLARGLQPAEAESLLAALAGAPPAPLPAPLALRGGVARGPLLGGCLSLLAATVGTPWLPPLAGAVLFLEDIDEPEYRIDRMLTHLGLSGTLSHVHGTVVGHLGRGWEQGPAAAWQRQSLLATPGPVSFGLPVGHGVPNHTLPLGREAVLDADRGELRFD